MTLSRRAAGLLLHPTSLPGRFGVGDLGPEADAFLEWTAAAGQRLWQFLPLGPTDAHGSPYSGRSAFAGNPLLISPERLVEDGFLPAASLQGAPAHVAHRVDFSAVAKWKEGLHCEAWERFRREASADAKQACDSFANAPDVAAWLDDWALYAALKRERGDQAWTDWDDDVRLREASALRSARTRLHDECAYHVFLQHVFERQWSRVRARAEGFGVHLIGDLPIFPAHDSADVWARQDLFKLDAKGLPERVAGVPPDYFATEGQLWGNPVYRWDRMEAERYAWWIRRIRAGLARTHLLRLDHFRGFVAAWEIPAGAKTAASGAWTAGPGAKLFEALADELGLLPLIAEDLGFITPDVHELRDAFGLPGMKVLQFAFGEADSPHLPHRHTRSTVAYTGTHDNDTTRGWFATAADDCRARVADYAGDDAGAIEWSLIRIGYASVARSVIVPLQDVFGLGSEARMNVPGKAKGNWGWRAEKASFSPQLAARLRRLAELTGRIAVEGAS